jgi:hypothetical protein
MQGWGKEEIVSVKSHLGIWGLMLFCVYGTGDGTQNPALTRQALYTSSPFASVFVTGSPFLCLDWLWTPDPPASKSSCLCLPSSWDHSEHHHICSTSNGNSLIWVNTDFFVLFLFLQLSCVWNYSQIKGFLFWFGFFTVIGFELRAYSLSHSTSPFLW